MLQFSVNNMLNREIGLIKFQQRIMTKTTDLDIPLLERLNYLAIVSKNCDELFEVRIARLIKLNSTNPDEILPDGKSVKEIAPLISSLMLKLYTELYNIYNNHILPSLAQKNIFILPPHKWDKSLQKYALAYFIKHIKPILKFNFININTKHKQSNSFVKFINKNLHFILELSHINQLNNSNATIIVIIEVNSSSPLMIKMPDNKTDKHIFISMQDIIIQQYANKSLKDIEDILSSSSKYKDLLLSSSLNNITIKNCYAFRITRLSDFNMNQINHKNIHQDLYNKLDQRNDAQCSRIELSINHDNDDNNKHISKKIIKYLLNYFNLTINNLYLADGPINFAQLNYVYESINCPHLKFPEFVPGIPKELKDSKLNIFEALKQGDILIHTPYQSFNSIVELIRQAVLDPQIKTIKITLYRTSHHSELVHNLINMAKIGKKVVVSIELFARFEENANANLATQLKNAGAQVVYGGYGDLKIHAKILLIERLEGDKLVKYAHLSTGNYHQETAKTYTDFGLLTTNQKIVCDIEKLFTQITKMRIKSENKTNTKIDFTNKVLTTIIQSPFALHEMLIQNIKREADHAKISKKSAKIIAKVNSLTDPQIINALYKASQVGVEIQLIIRGTCTLRPGIKNLSENIHIKSIVGRFLEHHRIFYFYNNGAEDTYISSADWMERNFFHRIEICVPILDKKIKKRIIEEGLVAYLADNVDSYLIDQDGNYSKDFNAHPKLSAQKLLMQKLGTINLNTDNI